MWYAFRTRPQREFRARDELLKHGIGSVVPSEFRFRRRARSNKRIRIERASLTGYILVNLPGDIGWWELLSLDDIAAVVGMNGQPIAICQSEIDRVTNHASRSQKASPFRRGDTVVVAEGPLADHKARVIGISREHATIIMEMLGASREVKMSLDNLEAVS